MHEFGDGSLHGTVVAADNSGFLQLATCVVARHLHVSRNTLADVDHQYAALGRLFQEIEHPRGLRGIARAKRAHDDGTEFRRIQYMTDDVLLKAREQRKDDNVWIERQVGNDGLVIVGLEDVMLVEREGHASIAEVRMVERVEGIEAVGIDFRRTVASQQPAAEVDTYFRHPRCAVFMMG